MKSVHQYTIEIETRISTTKKISNFYSYVSHISYSTYFSFGFIFLLQNSSNTQIIDINHMKKNSFSIFNCMHACVRACGPYLFGHVTWFINPFTLTFRRRQRTTKIDVKHTYTRAHTRRESLSQPQNIMYDKRVVRGSNYSHMHMQAVSSAMSAHTVFLCIRKFIYFSFRCI